MNNRAWVALGLLTMISLLLASCGSDTAPTGNTNQHLKVLAVESFLADIAQNVSRERIKIDTLIPLGMDPHAYQPTPQDVALISESQVLIVNGANFEEWLGKTLDNAGGRRMVIEASTGLPSRLPGINETIDLDHAGDPHFWLDPNYVIKYAENIRDGLIMADPAGTEEYSHNTENYIIQLKELDGWIGTQVNVIPPDKRLLVTDHESFGYFADRYGFTIIGTVIPGISSENSPSAMQMVALIDKIKKSGSKAIFLETGANAQLAEQIAQETGSRVITGLSTHSITNASDKSSGYIDMMKRNVTLIVAALK